MRAGQYAALLHACASECLADMENRGNCPAVVHLHRTKYGDMRWQTVLQTDAHADERKLAHAWVYIRQPDLNSGFSLAHFEEMLKQLNDAFLFFQRAEEFPRSLTGEVKIET